MYRTIAGSLMKFVQTLLNLRAKICIVRIVLWIPNRYAAVFISGFRFHYLTICIHVISPLRVLYLDYKGNYDSYVKTADAAIKNQMRVYQAYQDKKAHMMDFINKFRANAKRASIVQSRIKAVEKMDLEAPAAVEIEAIWRFSIPNPEPLGRPIIAIDDVTFDYKPEGKKDSEYILQSVNFGVDLDSRIGILGKFKWMRTKLWP